MSKIMTKPIIVSTLASSMILMGCSSSDDGGGTTTTATVPSGAVTITDANVVQVVTEAIATGSTVSDAVDTVTAAKVTTALKPGVIASVAISKVRDLDPTTAVSTPTGVAFSEPCDNVGGTVSGDFTETDTSITAVANFNNCELLGIIFNGTLNLSSVFDASGAYDDTLSGNINATEGGETASLTGLLFKETGIEFANYSVNTFTYAVDFGGSGGYLTGLEAAITGDDRNLCPDAGVVLVTGASDSQGKATFLSDNTVRIEYKDSSGNFVEASAGSPVACEAVI